MARDPIEDASFRVIGEAGPTEVLRRTLLEGLQDDPLYLRLKEVGWADKVLTQDLVAGMTAGMYYGTPDLPKLIGADSVPESTVRTWVDRFEDYVKPHRDGRNYKFPVAAVTRVRILYLLIKQLKWNFATIRNVLAGLVEQADLIEEAGQGDTRDVISILDEITPIRGVDYRSADPRLLYLITQLVDLQASAEAGRLVLSSEALPADIRNSSERIAQLEHENQRLQQKLSDATSELAAVKEGASTLGDRLQLAEGQINAQIQTWASVPPEELRAMLERQKKGFFARLFGR